MISDDTRRKIENIATGVVIEGAEDHCTAIRNQLCGRYKADRTVKTDFEGKSVAKEEQVKLIANYCNEHSLWVNEPLSERYLTRGGEALVYLHSDNRSVIKLNDAVYYATWIEFLNSLLLHNLFFSNTSYTLLGFVKNDDTLFAVLQQPYIISDTTVDIQDVRRFLEYNGFRNERRNDYRHDELGLILEDMHDENVLQNSETLFFIDSVFYVVER